MPPWLFDADDDDAWRCSNCGFWNTDPYDRWCDRCDYYIPVPPPERQTGRGSLLTHEFLHAAGPATLAAGAQGADPLGRSTGLHLRLAPHRGGTSVPAPWSSPGPGFGNPLQGPFRARAQATRPQFHASAPHILSDVRPRRTRRKDDYSGRIIEDAMRRGTAAPAFRVGGFTCSCHTGSGGIDFL